jgi:methyl coenzyme M reductase subunit D
MPIIENDEHYNPIKAYFKATSIEQVELEKENEITATVKRVIAEKGPISRNAICKLIKRKKATVLDAVKTLLALKEIQEAKNGLVSFDVFDI